jgi:hypothetical protein
LAAVGGNFEWEFNGLGVQDGVISMRRFEDLISPLGQTMRWTARDILFVEGLPETDAAVADLVEPVLVGTFAGSFGILLGRTSASEQLAFEGSLFDRTVERVMAIFRAAATDDPQREVLNTLTGFRARTLNGLQHLSERLAEAGLPSVIRWQGESVLTVKPEQAAVVVAAITEATPHEEEVTVQARLEGADLDTGSFHLVVVRPDPERDRHYRGKAESSASSALRGIRLGASVSATLVVLSVDSPILEQPKETFVLRQIAATDQDELLT